MATKDIQILIPGACECYLIWQKDLAGVIKLRILRWRDYSGLHGWIQCIKQNRKSRVTEDVIMEAEVRLMPLLERGPQVKEYGQPVEARKGKK